MAALQGLWGVGAILALALLLSTNRRAISVRVVASALLLQAGLAALCLYAPAGRDALASASQGVQAVIGYANAGIAMVFGPLQSDVGFSFAIGVLPIIIFFSALMSVLYHVGVMQLVIAWGGGALRFLLGVGKEDSMVAAANVFVGQTEAPLVIKPFIPHITRPQLFAILTSGMASVSGSVLAAYAQMGIKIDYLLAASFMSAPGGLLMAKIIMPDERNAPHEARDGVVNTRPHASVITAAAAGAMDGLKLAAAIGAMLIAFVSLIALVNGALGWVGGYFGQPALSMQYVLGFVFAPVMYLLNVPWSEAQAVGGVFGQKLILNEFVAYLELAKIQETLSPRAQAIATFALCGFANLSSIAILMGAMQSLAPERTPDVAKYGFHVVAAASLSNLMSAALAGIFLTLAAS